MKLVDTPNIVARWETKNAHRDEADTFISECLSKDRVKHEKEGTAFEDELTSNEVAVSHEQAAKLYQIHVALHEFHRRAVEEFTTPTPQEVRILLQLGYDLLRVLSRKGTIPALLTCRGYETVKYEALTQPPIELFGPSVFEEFFYEGIYDAKDLFHILDFAHDVLEWSTDYYRKHRDVGVIPPEEAFGLLDFTRTQSPSRILEEKDIRAVFRTKKSGLVEQANYLVNWRMVPFSMFKMIVQTEALDRLPPKSRSYQISRIIKKCTDEIVPSGSYDYGYYNRMILEEPPRRLPALEVLYLLKEHYAMRPDQEQSIRDKIHKKFYALINNPKFRYYYDEDARKDFRNLIGAREGQYEFE